jgi:hypothetical protein
MCIHSPCQECGKTANLTVGVWVSPAEDRAVAKAMCIDCLKEHHVTCKTCAEVYPSTTVHDCVSVDNGPKLGKCFKCNLFKKINSDNICRGCTFGICPGCGDDLLADTTCKSCNRKCPKCDVYLGKDRECDHCGSIFPNYCLICSEHTINGSKFCLEHSNVCSNCKCRFESNDYTKTLCNTCEKDSADNCLRCGAYVRLPGGYDLTREGLCDNCDSRKIHYCARCATSRVSSGGEICRGCKLTTHECQVSGCNTQISAKYKICNAHN